MNRKLAIVFVILCFGNIFGLAQTAQKKNVPNNLVLKIVSFKGKPASFQAVPEPSAGPEGGWFSLFQKISNWQLPAGELPIQAVNFVLRGEANGVKVTCSVYRGKFHEKEEFVAVYLIRENETVTVKELAKFGVEPFELSVVKAAPAVSAAPSVVNETNSLQATVEMNNSALPSYRLKVMNNSTKAVSMFSFITTSNNTFQLSGMPQGFQGEPLIKPGEIYEDVLPNTFQPEKNASEQIPAAAPNLILTVTSVVFADGTYEGNLQNAAQFLAFTFGRTSQLKRIISLLNEAAKNNYQVDKFSQQLSNLDFDVDQTDFDEFLKQFPPANERGKTSLRDSTKGAANLVKKTILLELQAFEANQKNPETNTFQDWLKATKEKYQNWLARLSVARQ